MTVTAILYDDHGNRYKIKLDRAELLHIGDNLTVADIIEQEDVAPNPNTKCSPIISTFDATLSYASNKALNKFRGK